MQPCRWCCKRTWPTHLDECVRLCIAGDGCHRGVQPEGLPKARLQVVELGDVIGGRLRCITQHILQPCGGKGASHVRQGRVKGATNYCHKQLALLHHPARLMQPYGGKVCQMEPRSRCRVKSATNDCHQRSDQPHHPARPVPVLSPGHTLMRLSGAGAYAACAGACTSCQPKNAACASWSYTRCKRLTLAPPKREALSPYPSVLTLEAR